MEKFAGSAKRHISLLPLARRRMGKYGCAERKNIMAEKRTVAAVEEKGLRNINNLILVGIMMAVGVVLRLCASFLVLGNMHPNFLIATYCLSILIIKPNVKEAAVIGFISGCISQIGTSMAWIGLASETIGAVAICLLIMIPMPKVVKALVTTFITTLISGFAFTGIAALTYANPMPMAQFLNMSLVTVVTAALNCVIVTILSIPVDKIINKD